MCSCVYHTSIPCHERNFAPEKCTWWGPIAALKTDISLSSAGSYYQGISENEFSKRSGNLFYLFDDSDIINFNSFLKFKYLINNNKEIFKFNINNFNYNFLNLNIVNKTIK